ncbi:amidohydrolase family protein [Pseudoalteromonas sp. MMG013]|uniref:amidohydrolase family protein n=1 Tax=Pseudoalteromonas sp. MMG013 TaxID=2822687 RepID=UPI001B37ED24|nr:amidohydrolase family protein [Pseudoalteromonas sp. MMG013]MBQ4864799.1 amidohydrolase family protein [Pseudoalteromonas sp. MMG013]
MKLLVLFTLILPLICQAKHELIIGDVTIINATSARTTSSLPKRWLRIRDGKIGKISAEPIEIGNAEYIDGAGQYLISGLMDTHVHLKTMPGLLPISKVAEGSVKTKLVALQNEFLKLQGRRYLYYGVTQVLDPSNTKEGIKKFELAGLSPKAFYCGAVPIFKGYNGRGFKYKELVKHRPYFVHQHGDPKVDNYKLLKMQQSPSSVVERMAKDGAKCVKVYIEDGFGTANNIPLIKDKTLLGLKRAALENDLPLMAHANATDMQEIAVDSKVDIMAHGNWNWLEEAGQATLPRDVKRVAQHIVKNDIAYQPSLNVVRGLMDVLKARHLQLPVYKTVLTNRQLDWYKSYQGQWFSRELQNSWGDVSKADMIDSFATKQRQGAQVLNYIYQQGGTVLLGSDTPPAPIYSSQPGLSTYWELRNMHNAGVDLNGILAAATVNNAKKFGLYTDYGTVETGKIANLLLLNSNPLSTIDAYDDIDSVILNGKRIKRTELLAAD